ncbi:hypothetical protein BH09MYX1_BH09MYX1_08200 [soil metagenome]
MKLRERILVALAAVLLVFAALACKASPGAVGSDGGSASTGPFKAGDDVDVEWNGDWWKATVVSVEAGPAYKVHYVGWGTEWDESVQPARIRGRTSGAKSK